MISRKIAFVAFIGIFIRSSIALAKPEHEEGTIEYNRKGKSMYIVKI